MPTLGILASWNPSYLNYVAACEERGIPHRVIDLLDPRWLATLREAGCDGFLARPPSDFQERNTIYMERLHMIDRMLGLPIYPSWDELFLYENKRAMAGWLELHGFPRAETWVFQRKEEALEHLAACRYPIVAKANIGAGSVGVVVLKSERAARRLARQAFGALGPKRALGAFRSTPKRRNLLPQWGRAQRHYLILQEYLPIRWEWRVIRLGESYFGFKKLLEGSFASGSGLMEWIAPPPALFDLLREVCERGRFTSMAMDVLETADGEYRINELQSIFGSSHPQLLMRGGKPGRYRFEQGAFRFEEGDYSRHEGYDLRVEYFAKLLTRDRDHAER
jgi:glutathione synthase/RimK-type ligase-like ATP-grasp enzyme